MKTFKEKVVSLIMIVVAIAAIILAAYLAFDPWPKMIANMLAGYAGLGVLSLLILFLVLLAVWICLKWFPLNEE